MQTRYKRTKRLISKPPTPEVVMSNRTREQIEKEYAECINLTKRLQKKYRAAIDTRRKTIYTLGNFQWISNHLCDRLGCRKTKIAVVNDGLSHYDGHFVVMAHYGNLFHEYNISTLLHELAHHIVDKEKTMKGHGGTSYCHSGDYLWVLEMLWDMWYGEKK